MLSTISQFLCANVMLIGTSLQASPVACWNFDEFDGNSNRMKASHGNGMVVIGDAWTESAISSPGGTNLNAIDEQPAGNAMGLSGMARNGRFFEVTIPGAGSGELHVSSATRRSGSGYTAVILSASVDGGNSFQEIDAWAPAEKWTVHSTSLPTAVSGENLIIRFTLDGATAARGNIRFDNLVIARKAMPKSVEGRLADQPG
ncbi:MAG: hypothetical protein P8M22_04385 [Phycisphaerales bacterium]|nr:hypothetical protein [Phycisphaerales bacterium]